MEMAPLLLLSSPSAEQSMELGQDISVFLLRLCGSEHVGRTTPRDPHSLGDIITWPCICVHEGLECRPASDTLHLTTVPACVPPPSVHCWAAGSSYAFSSFPKLPGGGQQAGSQHAGWGPSSRSLGEPAVLSICK
jgi:hypothetical protein